jgi:hypothetical protein
MDATAIENSRRMVGVIQAIHHAGIGTKKSKQPRVSAILNGINTRKAACGIVPHNRV